MQHIFSSPIWWIQTGEIQSRIFFKAYFHERFSKCQYFHTYIVIICSSIVHTTTEFITFHLEWLVHLAVWVYKQDKVNERKRKTHIFLTILWLYILYKNKYYILRFASNKKYPQIFVIQECFKLPVDYKRRQQETNLGD